MHDVTHWREAAEERIGGGVRTSTARTHQALPLTRPTSAYAVPLERPARPDLQGSLSPEADWSLKLRSPGGTQSRLTLFDLVGSHTEPG